VCFTNDQYLMEPCYGDASVRILATKPPISPARHMFKLRPERDLRGLVTNIRQTGETRSIPAALKLICTSPSAGRRSHRFGPVCRTWPAPDIRCIVWTG